MVVDCSEQETGTGSPGKVTARCSLGLRPRSEMGGKTWGVFFLDSGALFDVSFRAGV